MLRSLLVVFKEQKWNVVLAYLGSQKHTDGSEHLVTHGGTYLMRFSH